MDGCFVEPIDERALQQELAEMQQEFEQPGSSSPSSPLQSTAPSLAQGDALAQLAALENHLAVLRQELVARDADSAAGTIENGQPVAEIPPETSESNLQSRDDEFQRRVDELDRRIAELELREESLNRREEELRLREEARSTDEACRNAVRCYRNRSPAITNEPFRQP